MGLIQFASYLIVHHCTFFIDLRIVKGTENRYNRHMKPKGIAKALEVRCLLWKGDLDKPHPGRPAEGDSPDLTTEIGRGRLFHRLADPVQDRTGDLERIWRRCLVHPAGHGLEPPEASETIPGAGRGMGADKKAREQGYSIVLIDKSGFMLQPLVRCTWVRISSSIGAALTSNR